MSCGYFTACEGCKECEGFCQATATTNSYVQIVANALGPANAPNLRKDDIIIKETPRTLLNDLVQYLNDAAALGATQNSGGYVAPYFTTEHVRAQDVNTLYQHFARGLGPAGLQTANKDGVVYADFFNALFDKINNATFQAAACDLCNTTCDSACVTMIQRGTGCSDCCDDS